MGVTVEHDPSPGAGPASGLLALRLGRHANSMEFDALQMMPALGAGWSGLVFALALIGFGAKAAIVPFNLWLPEAHSSAPSQVSALMSGVMIKTGLHGLLRVLHIRPTVLMQYTARSFGGAVGEHLLPRLLLPRTTRRAPRGVFPCGCDIGSQFPDPISERVYEPFFQRWAERSSHLRILQQEKVNVYLMYILLTVVLALAWVSVPR